MSFPLAPFQASLRGMLSIRVRPQLTLAMPAVVALAAPLLVDHRVAAAL